MSSLGASCTASSVFDANKRNRGSGLSHSFLLALDLSHSPTVITRIPSLDKCPPVTRLRMYSLVMNSVSMLTATVKPVSPL